MHTLYKFCLSFSCFTVVIIIRVLVHFLKVYVLMINYASMYQEYMGFSPYIWSMWLEKNIENIKIICVLSTRQKLQYMDNKYLLDFSGEIIMFFLCFYFLTELKSKIINWQYRRGGVLMDSIRMQMLWNIYLR